ncbi:thioesterase II family protein (plasmid) [Rhodococcus globerulus]|uniref:thioesterase II family protein n=1 Tax=Rhodococcus globerulus TaxID=33008 RepID=UPI0039E93AC5
MLSILTDQPPIEGLRVHTELQQGRLQRHRSTGATVRVICLPHAGSGVGGYRSWAPLLPHGVEFAVAAYPGRESRIEDPWPATLDDLTHEISDALDALPALPTVVFGHSMGALVGYELTRHLEQRGHAPRRLIVSGRRPPTLHQGGSVHTLGDAAMTEEVRRLGGTAPELLTDTRMRALIVDAVRRDYHLVETHLLESFPQVSCPISVFTGSDDPELAVVDAPSWTALSTHSAPDVRVFDGDHFYLTRNRLPVVDALVQRIDPADLPTSEVLFP